MTNNISTWNSMFNECIKLKYDFIEQFGKYEYYDFKVMLNMMKLDMIPYNEIFDQIQINQYKDLVLVRYGLAELQCGFWEDNNSPLREARSLVFDIEKEEMVLTPFRKFFNLNEIEENSIENIEKEINKCIRFEVSEKLDGSMQSYRYYNDEIIGSGSMALDICNSFRLEEGYSMLTKPYREMIEDYKTFTFIFEYISEKDKHVVPYDYEKEKGLYLIGARSTKTGRECSYRTLERLAKKYGIKHTKVYMYDNLSDVLDYIKTMNVEDGEGFVLNIEGHKVKIKNEDYLQLHRLDDKLSSPNVIIKAFADGSFDDLYSNMTETMKSKNKDTINIIEKYIVKMYEEINYYKDLIKCITYDSECHKFINNLNTYVKEYVRMEYLGKPYNILKSNGGKYKKMRNIKKALEYLNMEGDKYE